MDELTGAELEKRAAAGDREAFGELYERYSGRVYDFLLRMVRERAEAADLTQETFVRALRSLKTERAGSAEFVTWLFTIARNLAITRMQRAKRTQPLIDDSGVDELDEASYYAVDPERLDNDPEQLAQAGEMVSLVWEASLALEPKQRTLLDLHLRQELDSAQIASVLGVTKGNAYTMVSRMKDSFENAVASLVMFRAGRRNCEELNALLERNRATRMSPEVRKVIERHTQQCETCQGKRRELVSASALLRGFVPLPLAPGLAVSIRDNAWTQAQHAGPAGLSGVEAAGRTVGGHGARPLSLPTRVLRAMPGPAWLAPAVAAAIVAAVVAVPVAVVAMRSSSATPAGTGGDNVNGVAGAATRAAAGSPTGAALAPTAEPTRPVAGSDEDALWAAIRAAYPGVAFVADCHGFVPSTAQPLCPQAGGWPAAQLDTGLASIEFHGESFFIVLFGREADGTWAYFLTIGNGGGGPPFTAPLEARVCAGGDGMNLRAEPSTAAQVVTLVADGTTLHPDRFELTQAGALPRGTTAESQGSQGDGWYHFTSPQAGWGYGRLLVPQSAPGGAGCEGWWPRSAANVLGASPTAASAPGSFDGSYDVTFQPGDVACAGGLSGGPFPLTIAGTSAKLFTIDRGDSLSGTVTSTSGQVTIKFGTFELTGSRDASGNLTGTSDFGSGCRYPFTTSLAASATLTPLASCPDAATLLTAWNAAAGLPHVTGFTDVRCWQTWVVARFVGSGGFSLFSTASGGLQILWGNGAAGVIAQLCADPAAPAGWKTDYLGC
jgi:RNA polymerase sigma factor (sigma-70 family)